MGRAKAFNQHLRSASESFAVEMFITNDNNADQIINNSPNVTFIYILIPIK